MTASFQPLARPPSARSNLACANTAGRCCCCRCRPPLNCCWNPPDCSQVETRRHHLAQRSLIPRRAVRLTRRRGMARVAKKAGSDSCSACRRSYAISSPTQSCPPPLPVPAWTVTFSDKRLVGGIGFNCCHILAQTPRQVHETDCSVRPFNTSAEKLWSANRFPL